MPYQFMKKTLAITNQKLMANHICVTWDSHCAMVLVAAQQFVANKETSR